MKTEQPGSIGGQARREEEKASDPDLDPGRSVDQNDGENTSTRNKNIGSIIYKNNKSTNAMYINLKFCFLKLNFTK
jgi:hypothetical protein